MNIPIGSRIYLDANVFIYAAEAPNSFPQLAPLFTGLDQGNLFAVTSALTLAEVMISPIRAGDTILESAYRNRLVTGPTLMISDINRDILIRAAFIRANAITVKLPDAIHAATCQMTGCTAFITNDFRIKSVVGLPVILISELT